MSIVIDSITYDVPVLEMINRKADILFKYAERTENGNLRAEAIGTYYNYDLQIGKSENNATDYSALWTKITDPNHEHTIIMPDGDGGTLTFGCYFASMTDKVKRWKVGGETYYRELTFSVIALGPARTP